MSFPFFLVISTLLINTEAIKLHKRPSYLSTRPIVGGVDARINNFPYQVSLARNRGNRGSDTVTSHFCGGSIISVDWVLTAAHCVEGTHRDDVVVRVGTSNRDEGGHLHNLSKIVVHADFHKHVEYDFDIALLKVATPFEFGSNVKPISLNKIPLQSGAIVMLSGWGTTTEGGDLADKLQKVEVPIVPQWECKWLYGSEKISESMFCGGRGGKDSCQGDSGGPVASNGYLIGVVSWGEGCARPGYPGVYTSVEQLRKWILQNSGV